MASTPPSARFDPDPLAGTAPADVLDSPEAGGVAIRGSAVRSAGYFVGMALSLASLPLVTRYLGVVEFGRYAQVVSLVAMAGTITDAGLGALGVREYAIRPAHERDRLMANLLGLRLVLTVVAVLLGAGFTAIAGYGPALVVGTLLAGAGLVLYVAQGALGIPLAAELRLGWATLAEVLRQTVLVISLVALVLAESGIVALLAAPILAGAIGLGLTAWLVRGRTPFRPSFDVAQWGQLLRETLPLAAAGLIYNVYFRLVLLLMGLVATGLETGYFALSFRVIEALMAVPFLLIGALLPLLARAARDDRARLAFGLARNWDVAMLCAGWFTLGTVLGASFVIDLIAPAEGEPAVRVLQIQGFALGLAFLTVMWGNALVAMRWHRPLVVGNAVALVVTLVVAALLVGPFGAQGAALATVVGELTLLAAYLLAVVRRSPDLRPSMRILPRVLLAAAVGALAAQVSGLADILRVALGSIAYFAVLGVLGGIPRELTDALMARVRRPVAS